MSRLTLRMLDVSGWETDVEVTIRLDVVEFWSHARSRAVFDRDLLRNWLNSPEGLLTADDVFFTLTRDGVMITIDPVVPWWRLPPERLAELRARV